VDAFDADVLIYAAHAGDPLGERVRALFSACEEDIAGVGSLLLLPEVLSRPLRHGSDAEVDALVGLLSRIDLRPVDRSTAEIATTLGRTYALRAADAVHLATALIAGADRFITNNRRDFARSIKEVDVVYPDQLEAP